MPGREYRGALLGFEVQRANTRFIRGGWLLRPVSLGKAAGRKRFPPRLSSQPCLVSGTPSRESRIFWLKLRLERCLYGEEVIADGARFRDGFLERDVGDLRALEDDETAELAGVHEVDGSDAVARGEHAVVGRGRAAALGVAEVDAARFIAGALLDLFGERLPDPRKTSVAEGVDLCACGDLAFDVRELRAFGDDDDGEALAGLPTLFEKSDDVVHVDGALRGEDDVGAAGDADCDGDPAGVAAHDLDDLHAGVRFGGGVKAVDGFGGDGDGGVEAEADVGAGEVVVDGFRDADAGHAALDELDGDGLRVVTTEGDEGVEVVFFDVGETLLEAAFNFFYVGARGAKDGAAAMEDTASGLKIERHGLVVDDAAPAFHEADELVAVEVNAFAHSGANNGVEAGAVAAPGKHSNPHW